MDALVTGTGGCALCLTLLLTLLAAHHGWTLLTMWGAARYAEDDAGSGRWLVR